MKRFLGFFLCMGMLFSGAAFASPPGTTDSSIEITAVTDIGPGPGDVIVMFEAASDQAMHQALAATAVERARAMECAPLSRLLSDLQANGGDNRRIVRLIDRRTVHRWRAGFNDYRSPVNMIYRPAWKRKVCEG